METWSQLYNRSKDQIRNKHQGSDKPFEGVVSSVNHFTEQFLVSSHGGQRRVDFPQPLLNYTSWIRGTPDTGLGLFQTFTSDTKTIIPLRYQNPNAEERIKGYTERKNVYRHLQSGEIDINSRGYAQAFFSRRGVLDLRGGVIRSWHDQDQVEFGAKAPTHHFVFHQNRSNVIGDELRMGVIKRPELQSSLDGSGNKSSLVNIFPKINNKFAKEFLFKLQTVDGSPSYLFDIREGHVFDDNGQPGLNTVTGKHNRIDRKYFTNVDSIHRIQLDENGNRITNFPNEATLGEYKKIPKGSQETFIGINEKKSIGNNKIQIIGNNCTLDIKNIYNLNIGKSFNIKVGSTTLTISGSGININTPVPFSVTAPSISFTKL